MDPSSPKFNSYQHHQEIGLDFAVTLEMLSFGTHCLSFGKIMFKGHEVVQLYVSLITMWVKRCQPIAVHWQWFQSSFSHRSWSVIFYITVSYGGGGVSVDAYACSFLVYTKLAQILYATLNMQPALVQN